MSFWIKGTATDYVDFSNQLAAILDAASTSVESIAINSGGTGYTVGDVLTVAGGTATITAQVEVTSVSSGVIDGVRIFNAGSYTADPTTTANAVTGGTGSGATIDLTMSDVGWTVDRDEVWNGGSEREVIAHGEGAGADAIYVGWRTFSNVGGDYYNWELHGMTGFNGSVPINEQPNVSPGDHENGAPDGRYGAYLILSQNSFNWWINVNSYRVAIVANVGGGYWNAYLGWGNRFATSSEYPYPMYVSSTTEIPERNSSTSASQSGIVDPWSGTGTVGAGGSYVYKPGGTWEQCVNRRSTNPNAAGVVVLPTQRPAVSYTAPRLNENAFTSTFSHPFYAFNNSTSTGNDGTPSAIVRTTGDDDDHVMLPCFLFETTATSGQILMEIDECRWTFNFGGVSAEDRYVEADGSVWRVFSNGNRNSSYAYLAIKESD